MDLWSEMDYPNTDTVHIKQELAESYEEDVNIEYHIPDYDGADAIQDDADQDNIDIKYHHLEDSWKDTTIQDLIESYSDRTLSSNDAGSGSAEILFRNHIHKDKSNLLSTLQRLALRVEPKDTIYGEVVSARSILPKDKPGCHFKCDACNRCYRYKHTLKAHVDNECGKEPQLKCPECDRRFKQSQNLKSHFMGRHPDKTWVPLTRLRGRKKKNSSSYKRGEYECAKCGNGYTRKAQLRTHMLRCADNKRETLRCAHCVYTTLRLYHLRRHLESRHNETSRYCRHVNREAVLPFEGPRFNHQCLNCDKSYQNRHALDRHRRLECHLEVPKIACEMCHLEATIQSTTDVTTGVNNEPVAVKIEATDPVPTVSEDSDSVEVSGSLGPRRKRIKCDKCQRFFLRLDRLKEHVCGSVFKCAHCRAVLGQRSSLLKHLKVRHPEVCGCAPLAWGGGCRRCFKTFAARHQLVRHEMQCGAPKLRCPRPTCTYRASFKQTLQRHVTLGKHSDDVAKPLPTPKPWSCQVCHRGYLDKGSYMKHIRYKCGKNPRYPCDNCPRSYRDKNGLSRHIMYECGKEPQLQCPHCSYRAKRKYTLNNHIISMHNLDPQAKVVSSKE